MRFYLISIVLLAMPDAFSALPACDPVYGPISISDTVQMVFNYQKNSCLTVKGDYADNPVRPFLVGPTTNPIVMWFASNSKGYFKTIGIRYHVSSSRDILAGMQRVYVDGQCVRWLTSRFNSLPNQYPVASYNNELWMVAPYTPDGKHVYAFVHNEYHIVPQNVQDVYGNLIAAQSTNGAKTFQLYKDPLNSTANMPVIASPYLYDSMRGKGGIFAQSNIIHWGHYYYMLIFQGLSRINLNAPATSTGVCIYRTDNIANPRSWLGWGGQQYNVPLIPPSYPEKLRNPQDYVCKPVLPPFYRFSWSYNTILHHFIIIGLNTHYVPANKPLQKPMEAFVYTLADLNATTGELSPAMTKKGSYVEYLLKPIVWIDEWKKQGNVMGQAYPSILDPMSPKLSGGAMDRNFQFSGAYPYIYYTLLHPRSENHGRNRDVVRQALTVNKCMF